MEARFLRNVLIKALVLLALVNFAFVAAYPLDGLGKISGYNSLFRGRQRLPFGENPQQTYNFSLYNLEAMLQSLALDGATRPDAEFRVLVIGDSSAWGTLLRPEETLAGQLQDMNLAACDGRPVRVYNLAYPTLSLLKDMMILDMAMRYQPDLILWPLTLQSFPHDRQAESPLVQNNARRVLQLAENLDFPLPAADLSEPGLWQRTLFGQRRALADWLRLQLYGPMWSATGIDQLYPSDYQPAARDLQADPEFNGWPGPHLNPDDLAWDVLGTGIERAGDVPVLLVNEPVLVSSGENSDIRYNYYYPRWAYDQYRQLLSDRAVQNGWQYLDLWNLVPEDQFTNSAIHLTPYGVQLMAAEIRPLVQQIACRP